MITLVPTLTAAEVADLFHVSPRTVSTWARQGKLPHQRTLGGHRRYDEAEVRAFAARFQQTTQATHDPATPAG